MSVDKKHSMKICSRCGKIVRPGYKGTMTGWIFGGNPCSCARDGNGQLSGQESGHQSMLPKPGQHQDHIQFSNQTPAQNQIKSQKQFEPHNQIQTHRLSQPLSHAPDLRPRYEVMDFLGEGGMGSVYKIREIETGKIFAAKVLKDFLANDPSATRRFELEVRAAGELTHPNLVFIFGSYRSADGTPYMVMNFVDGTSLGELLKFEHFFPYQRALPIFIQVADALTHAHGKGIIHRDLKPNNILIYQHESRRDAVRVVDFGIAKIINPDNKMTEGFTQTGEIFGSPLYMSPEQCSGEKLDARSDIYSLGCLMYHTLYGQPPFNDSNPMKTMLSHMKSPPTLTPDCKSKNVPKDVERVVMRCLAKNPAERYQNSDALANDLNAILTGRSISGGKFRTNLIVSQWRIIAVIAASLVVGAVTATGATLLLVHRAEQGAPKSTANAITAPTVRTTYSPSESTDLGFNGALQKELTARLAAEKIILAKAQPIQSTTMMLNGQMTRQFAFPPCSLGSLYRFAKLNLREILVRNAKGIVYVPAGVPLTLAVESGSQSPERTATLSTPTIFGKINPSEFYGLALRAELAPIPMNADITSNVESSDIAAILKFATNWTNLQMVSLRYFQNIDQALPLLNRMKNLHYFEITRCSFSSAESIDQPFLNRLTELKMGDLDKAVTAKIMKRLANAQNLEVLSLTDLNMTADLLDNLRNCPKLESLLIQQKKMNDVPEAIARLKNLHTLSLEGNLTDEQARNLLHRCPQIKSLKLGRLLTEIETRRLFGRQINPLTQP
jgi:hypothetical protein